MQTQRDRLNTLKDILQNTTLSTQEELREKLERAKFAVNQSTISRDLRRLGAVRTTDNDGRVVYKLPEEFVAPVNTSALTNLVLDIEENGAIIVIHTSAGSASLVARHLDNVRPGGILGPIAGDDTIFVAPKSIKGASATVDAIWRSVRPEENN
jgi:transcriptional regulator of arginine metabolism